MKPRRLDAAAAPLLRAARSSELAASRAALVARAASAALSSLTPAAVALCGFALYTTALGRRLTSERIFPSLLLFAALTAPLRAMPALLRHALTGGYSAQIPSGTGGAAAAAQAARRIQRFLERPSGFGPPPPPLGTSGSGSGSAGDAAGGADSVAMCKGAEFGWGDPPPPTEEAGTSPPTHLPAEAEMVSLISSRDAETTTGRKPISSGFTVGPLDLQLRLGELTVVAGPRGCGKTTLLSGFSGDAVLTTKEGSLTISPRIAVVLCPHRPWLVAGTIADNVAGASALGVGTHHPGATQPPAQPTQPVVSERLSAALVATGLTGAQKKLQFHYRFASCVVFSFVFLFPLSLAEPRALRMRLAHLLHAGLRALP